MNTPVFPFVSFSLDYILNVNKSSTISDVVEFSKVGEKTVLVMKILYFLPGCKN